MPLVLENGRCRRLDPPCIDFDDPAVQFGAGGFFETMRVEAGRVHLFAAHIERLERALAAWRIAPPADRDGLSLAVAAEAARHPPHAALRVRVTVGPAPAGEPRPDGLWPARAFVAASALDSRHVGSLADRPALRLTTAHGLTAPSIGPWVGFKSTQRWHYWEALRRARAMGFDEAILANERGEIVEASAFNVFWTVGDRAFTPAPECGPLPGVFAAYFTRLAAEAGVEVRSVRADVADLALADAIVLTNSLGEAMTAASLDDRPLQRPPDRSAIGLVLNEIDARRSERADARLHPASADFALRPESPSAATDSSAPRR